MLHSGADPDDQQQLYSSITPILKWCPSSPCCRRIPNHHQHPDTASSPPSAGTQRRSCVPHRMYSRSGWMRRRSSARTAARVRFRGGVAVTPRGVVEEGRARAAGWQDWPFWGAKEPIWWHRATGIHEPHVTRRPGGRTASICPRRRTATGTRASLTLTGQSRFHVIWLTLASKRRRSPPSSPRVCLGSR